MEDLYNEATQTPDEPEALYTADDTVVAPDTNTGNYSVVKSVASLATGNVEVPDVVNFDTFVDSEWRKTVPVTNDMDRSIAENAAARGQTSIVQQTLDSVAARNKLYGEMSVQNAEVTRTKLKELTDNAVENVAVRNPAVLFNNTPQ